jgi:hypothetical protein
MVTKGASVNETNDTRTKKGNWITFRVYSAEYLISL